MRVSLVTIWRKLVDREPRALALIDGANGRRWTRSELCIAATQWGEHIGAARAGFAGRRVLVAEPNGAAWFEVYLGLLQLGAVPVLADATEPLAALVEQARTLRAVALWHHGRLERLPESIRHRRADLCLFKLTSGSTGAAKALPFTHAQMLADGRQICASMGIRPDDLNLAVIPLGHSYGLGNLVVPLLAQGTPLLCSASPLPQALANDIARWRTTVFPAVPTLLRAMVRSAILPSQLASLRLIISAGAVLPAELAQSFAEKFNRRIHNFYGASETGGICYDRLGEATLSGRSVGKPIEGVRLRFREGQRLVVESAAVGGAGRFLIADRAALTAGGEVVLLGRSARTVKIAGRRLDLTEVENALLALRGVRGACVLVHPKRPDALAAVVAGTASEGEIRAALVGRLAPWKIPSRVRVVAELPVTERGKTDRQAIAKLAG